jgi:hypothetical protein
MSMKKIFLAYIIITILAFITIGSYYFLIISPKLQAPEKIEAQPEKTAQQVKLWRASRNSTYMILKNVKFRFSDEIFITINDMVSVPEPIKPYRYVDMNDENSFSINIISGKTTLEPVVMETLFAKSVLNYQDAPLKDLKQSIIEVDVDGKKEGRLRIAGMMKMGMWLEFEMIAKVSLEKETGRLMIEAEKIKSVGNPFVKGMMDMTGLSLESLMSIKPGRGVTIKKNVMYVEALALMPPPKLSGKLIDVAINIQNKNIDMTFGEDNPPKARYSLLVPKAKNYIYICQGSVIFGKMLASDGRTQLIDSNPSDPFDFYLKKYLFQISKSSIRMTEGSSLIIYMPDYASLAGK